MSYTIVYNRKFLKIDDKIIPLALYGSNNCYEVTIGGRERREREWNPMYFSRNCNIAKSVDEIMDKIDSLCAGGYQEHFMRNGKWVDDKSLVRFFQNGIKEAKTIEEMHKEYFFNGLRGYISVWDKTGNHISNRVEVSSSETLREFLTLAQARLDKRVEDEEIYICLQYYDEEFKAKVKRGTVVKPKLSNYYVIKVNNVGYFIKQTSRNLRYGYAMGQAKQFATEREAIKYLDKLKQKYSAHLEVVHIAE